MPYFGAIYAAHNPRDGEDVFKVGMTRRDVNTRMSELTADTSNLGTYRAVCWFVVHDALEAEKACHTALSEFRIQENREFFRCNLGKLTSLIEVSIRPYLVEATSHYHGGAATDPQKDPAHLALAKMLVEHLPDPVSLVSEYVALSPEMIKQFEDKWDFSILVGNWNVTWTADLLRRYQAVLDFSALNVWWTVELLREWSSRIDFEGVINIEYTEELLREYEVDLYWPDVSAGFPWNARLIDEFAERIYSHCISENECISWSMDLLYRYAVDQSAPSFRGFCQWDWETLSRNPSLPWSDTLIERYAHRWDWGSLARNEGVTWSEALLKKYESRLKFGEFWIDDIGVSAAVKGMAFENFCRKANLPWSMDFIEGYVRPRTHHLSSALSRNSSLPWSDELIGLLKRESPGPNRELSSNVGLPWSVELIESHYEIWVWEALTLNESLPWSLEFIKTYEAYWSWDSGNSTYGRTLSDNAGIPWSLDLLKQYEDRWHWFDSSPDPEERGDYGLVPNRGFQKYLESHGDALIVALFDVLG